MDPATVGLIGALLALIKMLKDHDAAYSRDAIDALQRVSEAASKTLAYEASRQGDQRDKLKEQEISASWYQASYPVQKFSPELAERLRKKGDYWEAPEFWTELEIVKNGIGLKQVRLECEKALAGYIK